MSDQPDPGDVPQPEPEPEQEPEPEPQTEPEPAAGGGGVIDSPTPNAHVVGVTIVEGSGDPQSAEG